MPGKVVPHFKPEAAPAVAAARRHRPRFHRTGRNTPFSCKITQEAYDAIYAICDEHGLKIGEIVERGIALLQQELKGGKGRGGMTKRKTPQGDEQLDIFTAC